MTLLQTLRAARPGAVRTLRPQSSSPVIRTISTTTVRKADPVQDIYLRHLRDYKVPPTKPGDAESQVHKFVAPQPPKSPEESNLASELKSYQDQPVEVEGQQPKQEVVEEPDWFEELEDYEAIDKEHYAHQDH